AVLLERTDMPGRRLLGALALSPLYLSPQVIGFGAIIAYGPMGIMTLLFQDATGIDAPWDLYTLTGMALVTALSNAPITTLYCIVSARQQDPNHDASARITGAGTWQILRRISLPLMRPALIFALIMNVVNSVETLAIPLIIGGPVQIDLITTLIYKRSFQSSGIPQYGLVAALAMALIIFVSLLFWLQRFLMRKSFRFVGVGPKAGAARRLPLGPWRWAATGALGAYVLFGVVVIVGAVVLRSGTYIIAPGVPILETLTTRNFMDLLAVDVYRRSIVNTVVLALIGAAAGTALIAGIALVTQRSNFFLRRLLDAFAQLPRVLPGMIVGLGVFYASVFIPGMSVLRDTIWLLLIAFLIRFMSAGYGIVAPALVQITTDFDKAAQVAGAGWTTTMFRIVVPLQKHALLSCFVLLMVLIIKEYASAVFLMAPGSEVIGSTMLSLWAQGSIGPVAALSVVQIGLTAVLVAISTRIFGVRLYG
ncbi:MAG: ABC transporter permease, partial [Advenella sp.]